MVSPRGNAGEAEASEFATSIERDPQGRPRRSSSPRRLNEIRLRPQWQPGKPDQCQRPQTNFSYDADNELTKIEQPNGDVLETGYDGAGPVTSQTDGNEHTTEYIRNVLGEPVEVIDPLSRRRPRNSTTPAT